MTTKEQIEKLKKAIASPATPENFKGKLKEKLAHLEAELQKEEHGAHEKKETKHAEKKEHRGSKKKKHKKEKKEKRGYVKVTAKKAGETAEPSCDELLKRFNERRAAAKKSQRKAKTTPVFTKIASDVVDAVEKAIKNVPAAHIENAPTKTINKFENLKNSAESFLKAFKEVLGSDYKSSESEKEIKELEDLISKLEKKYSGK